MFGIARNSPRLSSGCGFRQWHHLFPVLALPDPEETGFIFEWCNGNRKERENKQTNVFIHLADSFNKGILQKRFWY